MSRERAISSAENMNNLPIVHFYDEAEQNEAHKELLLKHYANGRLIT